MVYSTSLSSSDWLLLWNCELCSLNRIFIHVVYDLLLCLVCFLGAVKLIIEHILLNMNNLGGNVFLPYMPLRTVTFFCFLSYLSNQWRKLWKSNILLYKLAFFICFILSWGLVFSEFGELFRFFLAFAWLMYSYHISTPYKSSYIF